MSTQTLNRTMTVLTSEAHVLAVARRYDLPVYRLDGVLTTTRDLATEGRLVYRTCASKALVA